MSGQVQKETIQLSKPEASVEMGSQRLRVNLGWDPTNDADDRQFDLDLSCLLLNESRRLESGKQLIYYGQRLSKDGCVVHSSDDRSGKRSDGGPDEWIDLDLIYISNKIQEILFVVTVYDHGATPVFLGDVENLFVDVRNDETHASIHHRRLEGAEIEGKKSMEIGSLVRTSKKREWDFVVSGKTHEHGLEGFIELYSDLDWAFSTARSAPVIDLNSTVMRRSSPPTT